MAEFIHFEVEHSNDESIENESDISDHNSFINDDSENENEEGYGFANDEVNLEQANREALERGLERIENCDKYSNLCADSDDDEAPLDKFEKSEQIIRQFKNELLPKVKSNDEKFVHNELIRVILYAIRDLIENKKNICDILELKQNTILDEILEKFSCNNLEISLDLQEFNRVAYQINNVLLDYNYFLRVFEQKINIDNFLSKNQKKRKKNNIKLNN